MIQRLLVGGLLCACAGILVAWIYFSVESHVFYDESGFRERVERFIRPTPGTPTRRLESIMASLVYSPVKVALLSDGSVAPSANWGAYFTHNEQPHRMICGHAGRLQVATLVCRESAFPAILHCTNRLDLSVSFAHVAICLGLVSLVVAVVTIPEVQARYLQASPVLSPPTLRRWQRAAVAIIAGCVIVLAAGLVQAYVRTPVAFIGFSSWGAKIDFSTPSSLRAELRALSESGAADGPRADLQARLRVGLSLGELRWTRPRIIPTWFGGGPHIPIAIPMLLAVAFLCHVRILRAGRRGYTSQCIACGYDLHGSDGVRCPECGAGFA